MSNQVNNFSDPSIVAKYAEGPPRLVPGFSGLQQMAKVLLAERAPVDARILVLGAGGGLELKVFAESQAKWRFDGVDPSAEMLRLATLTLGDLISRVNLHQGYIDVAPVGPYDAAACLLTLHFVPVEERRRILMEVKRRLKPGAPCVIAHLSFEQGKDERDLWLSRYVAFATASGVETIKASAFRAAVDSQLTILEPEQDEEILREAGFSGVSLFYVGFTFRGWVAYA